MRSYDYSPVHRGLEVFAIVSLFSLVALGFWRAWAAAGPGDAWWLAGAVFAGYVLADLMSGIVHWMGDRYGTEQTPLVGQTFVKPFREHHTDPKGMTRHDFVETNGNNSIVTVPVMAAAWLVPVSTTLGLFTFATVTSLAFWVFATNQFHKWSHEEDVPSVVSFAQRTGLILGVNHHDIHHTPPYETYYCITSGWLNWPLHKVRFWSRAEALVEKVTGIAAFRDDVPATDGPDVELARAQEAQEGSPKSRALA